LAKLVPERFQLLLKLRFGLAIPRFIFSQLVQFVLQDVCLAADFVSSLLELDGQLVTQDTGAAVVAQLRQSISFSIVSCNDDCGMDPLLLSLSLVAGGNVVLSEKPSTGDSRASSVGLRGESASAGVGVVGREL
jgi:hypothetical protein